jgi:hypothetical protein
MNELFAALSLEARRELVIILLAHPGSSLRRIFHEDWR